MAVPLGEIVRAQEIAELAVRSRDAGVVGFVIEPAYAKLITDLPEAGHVC
ncbi:hypothetical protein [Micromonospora sp. LOL_023]